MMKIFDKDCKYNFVDDNNVFVGYDSESICCEDYGYFFSDTIPDSLNDEEIQEKSNNIFDSEGWNFDTSFFREYVEEPCDTSSMAIFRLKKKDAIKYLVLYNMHNGYYSHGFEFKKKGYIIRDGQL
jgi:hypothetical protein